MREIKFRAWNNSAKMWQTAYSGLNCYGKKLSLLPNGDFAKNEGADITFCQYTGLKDKNGKEIYEGDILKHESHWSDGSTQSVATMISPFHCGDWSIESEDCEIIGNIYENSELIK